MHKIQNFNKRQMQKLYINRKFYNWFLKITRSEMEATEVQIFPQKYIVNKKQVSK